MSLDGERVPAWRRLGLALKHQDQSGVAVPEPQTSHKQSQSTAAYEAPAETHESFPAPVETAVNGKSSKLGKRKHQPEPAEDADQTSKKSKTSPPEGETIGVAVSSSSDIANTDSAPIDNANTDNPSSEVTEIKGGDSNYRKKKPKPPKRRREDNVKVAKKPRSFDDAVPSIGQSALLASTETDHATAAPTATSHYQSRRGKSNSKDASGSPSQIDRRKSVAFTPDTKTSDGNSGQELFKKWVAEQKGTGDVSAPPAVSNFTLHSLIAEEEKAARKNGQLDKKLASEESAPTTTVVTEQRKPPVATSATVSTETKTQLAPPPATSKISTPAAKGKKKDPSVYIAYLTQYHTDRDHWKFNKAKQNDVVDNALNIFRIPNEHSEALLEYVSGLKGAGVIERLQERCIATLKEVDDQDAQMDDAETRKVAEEEAEQERIAKERKRRKTEGDVESFVNHPHGDGYIRRLRRRRAEALLTALGRTAPILPVPSTSQPSSINPLMKSLEPPQRDARKRKRRTDVSSDESSSGSSDDDSSSDSDSDDSDDSEASSGSDGDDSKKGSGSNSDASSTSGSDSDSD